MYRYLFLLMIIGCSQVSIKPEINKFYKMDLYIYSEEKSGIGTLVLPRRSNYSIYIESDGKINLLTFRTCSREISIQDPRQGLSRKKFTIDYKPNEIEQAGMCQTEVMALNIEGKNSLGFIDFEDLSTTLHAINICGGVTELTGGVSICQERENMIEKIKFDVEVMAMPNNCKLDAERGTEFTYVMPRGRCVIAFVETRLPHRTHRHTLLGYESQLLSL